MEKRDKLITVLIVLVSILIIISVIDFITNYNSHKFNRNSFDYFTKTHNQDFKRETSDTQERLGEIKDYISNDISAQLGLIEDTVMMNELILRSTIASNFTFSND